MCEGEKSGGDPQTLGQCRECGSVYPVQTTSSGSLRPIGTGGGCECGNDSFEPVSE